MLSFLVCYFAENVCALFDHYGTYKLVLFMGVPLVHNTDASHGEEIQHKKEQRRLWINDSSTISVLMTIRRHVISLSVGLVIVVLQ